MTTPHQLVVVATAREADAITLGVGPLRGPFHTRPSELYESRYASGMIVAISGIGMAEASATTAHFLATQDISAVFSIGVAGGSGIPIRGVAVGTTIVRADTGIEDADGSFRTTREAIGLGDSSHALAPDLVGKILARLPNATPAHVLTVATVTGTADRAARVLERRPEPGPAVEDMEAWGVLIATLPHRVPFFAIKAVSNAIGPRDRSAWDLDGALDTLSASAAALFCDPPDWT